MNNNRYYSFSGVSYESIENILMWLEGYTCLSKYAISPLHQYDKKEDGSPKEPHYHIICTFTQNKSIKSLCEDYKNIFGTNLFLEPLQDKCGAFEYLTHENAPDKYQYNKSDIITNDYKYFQNDTTTKQERDNLNLLKMLDDIISGRPMREMVCEYGRDFVKNYKAYRDFAYTLLDDDVKNLY